MATISMIGLGGAGVGIVKSCIEWGKRFFDNSLKVRDKDYGCWIWCKQYNRHKEWIPHAFGALVLDANSNEFADILEGKLEELRGRGYITSYRPGFGGNWREQYEELCEMHEKSEEKSGPPSPYEQEEITLLNWLTQKLIDQSDSILYVFSLDGGTGAGIFRFLIENRNKYLPKKTRLFSVAIAPTTTELRRERRLENTLDTIQYIKNVVSREELDYSFIFDNDLLLLRYAELKGDISEREGFIIRQDISWALENNDYAKLVEIIERYMYRHKYTIKDVNSLIIASICPFFMMVSELFKGGRYEECIPKNPDFSDLVEVGREASFCAVGYDHAENLEEIEKKYKGSLVAWIENVILRMSVPTYYAYEDLGSEISGLIVVLWSSKRLLDQATRNEISRSLKEHYNLDDVEIYTLIGADPLKGYDLFGNASIRVWTYVKLRSDTLIKAKAEGIRR